MPIRLELGPKDIEKDEVKCVIRMNGEKMQLKLENIEEQVEKILEKIQEDMLTVARQKLMDKHKEATNWEEFMIHLNNRNVVLVPWCESIEC